VFTDIENITYRGSMSDDERETLAMCSTIFWKWIDGQIVEQRIEKRASRAAELFSFLVPRLWRGISVFVHA
jgi:hypothetical protein